MNINKLEVIVNTNNTDKRHAKCLSVQCNAYLDPIEYECGYNTTIDCDECKYGGGTKNPEAKCNQPK